MYTRVATAVLLYEYRHLVGHVSPVCSVHATSLYPLLVSMLVFDGAGNHNDPEFQILLFIS